FMFGQDIGGLVGGVISTTCHDGLIRIPLEEAHNHFVTDTWYCHHAVLATRPTLADTHPTRALVIAGTIAIPWELQLDPAIFVAINLFTRRSHDSGNLRSINHGFMW